MNAARQNEIWQMMPVQCRGITFTLKQMSKKILPLSIFLVCLSFFGCKGSAKNYPVSFVDRNAVFSLDKKLNPLMLVVEITEDGKLSLNKIETGTIDDVTVLSEKIKVIFDDRKKSEISERAVVINPQGKVKNEDLEKLIESLAEVKTSPIQVIKNGFVEVQF